MPRSHEQLQLLLVWFGHQHVYVLVRIRSLSAIHSIYKGQIVK